MDPPGSPEDVWEEALQPFALVETVQPSGQEEWGGGREGDLPVSSLGSCRTTRVKGFGGLPPTSF